MQTMAKPRSITLKITHEVVRLAAPVCVVDPGTPVSAYVERMRATRARATRKAARRKTRKGN